MLKDYGLGGFPVSAALLGQRKAAILWPTILLHSPPIALKSQEISWREDGRRENRPPINGHRAGLNSQIKGFESLVGHA